MVFLGAFLGLSHSCISSSAGGLRTDICVFFTRGISCSVSYLFDEYDGDDEVLARVDDIELTRRELRQASQYHLEMEGRLSPSRWLAIRTQIVSQVDDMQLYRWALALGLRASDEDIEAHIQLIRGFCAGTTACSDLLAKYGLTFDEYWAWKYEDARRAITILNLRRQMINVEQDFLRVIRSDDVLAVAYDVETEEYEQAVQELITTAREQWPVVWFDASTERIYTEARALQVE